MQQILYYLPLLACPVGMGLMMWFMGRGMRGNSDNNSTTTSQRMQPSADRSPWRDDTRTSRFGRFGASTTSNDGHDERTRDERLADLRVRFANLQERQQAIARELREMSEPDTMDGTPERARRG